MPPPFPEHVNVMNCLGIIMPEWPDIARSALGIPFWCVKNSNLVLSTDPSAAPRSIVSMLFANFACLLLEINTLRCIINTYPSTQRFIQSGPCLNRWISHIEKSWASLNSSRVGRLSR